MQGVTEIQNAVAELSETERAEVASFILASLPSPHHYVDDAEVQRRSQELENGDVQALTHAEFLKACGRE